ncbi:MAG: sulfite exporter TauE/SafE family protein [Desulfobulbaceae bacterium]|uniref:Probable membrane transporter protein n=1 Tax=Candidatus Desulfatifera sulfidica TaxID=2841691 RepID=A0A8J6TE04_9BACT|nr:sulfite exporter TauE/SafE family protein [Candidatus Desulfatifera sulfidica]
MPPELLTGTIFLVAGFIQGMTGFGSALIALPLLSLFLDIKIAVPLCILNSLVITTTMALQLKKHFEKKKILPLCLAAIPGVILGVTLLKNSGSDIIRISLALLLICYSLYSLLSTPKHPNLHPNWAIPAGFLSGLIGAIFSAGGPPTIIYTALSNWSKDQIKATLTGFFLFNSYLIAIAHTSSGLINSTVLSLFLYSAPMVLVGTLLGGRCYGLLKKDLYLKVIFAFLVVMGMMLLGTF